MNKRSTRTVPVWFSALALGLATVGGLLVWSGRPGGQVAASTARQAGESVTPDQIMVDGRVVAQRDEPREGEICQMCGKRITRQDTTYMVEGQRVPVHRGACVGALAAKPLEWFQKLKLAARNSG